MRIRMDCCEIQRENGQKLQLEYYLLADGESCGVEVRCRDGETESADAVPDITRAQSRAEELIRRLCRGAVTPVSLRDVLYDWLCAI